MLTATIEKLARIIHFKNVSVINGNSYKTAPTDS